MYSSMLYSAYLDTISLKKQAVCMHFVLLCTHVPLGSLYYSLKQPFNSLRVERERDCDEEREYIRVNEKHPIFSQEASFCWASSLETYWCF